MSQIDIFNNTLPSQPTNNNLQETVAKWVDWRGAAAAIIALLAGVYRGVAIATASFTRPSDTTAYASGDLVANSTTAGSVVPMTLTVARNAGGTGVIQRVRLKISGTVITNASFRVHFYRASPTVTNGDNGVWLSTESTYLGWCDVTVDKAFSDGAKGIGIPGSGAGTVISFDASAKSLYALIEARAAFTPISAEVFTLAVEVEQN